MERAAEGQSSVAPKLLHDMQSQSLTGMRLVQHLQVGCLMGCLTHLSLAGDRSVKGDPGWGRDTLLTSQYSALFLANPFLEYIDLSHTGLTNNGMFYLILELSYCDPSGSPYGHKCLKQVVLGPPFKPSGTASCQEPFMKTALSALQELYLQSPVLELVCLIHPGGPTVSPMLEAAHNMCHALWAGLDESNQATDSLYQGNPCSVLRTRKGMNAQVHRHPHRIKFSEKLLPGTWIAGHMKEAEEEMGVLDERPDDNPAVQTQRQRTMPSAWHGGTNTLQQHEGAAPAGSDGAIGIDANGDTTQQHGGRLPDLPLYHTGPGNNGSRQQSILPYQTDTGSTGDRQQSRQGHRHHREHTGGAIRTHRPQQDGATHHRSQQGGSARHPHRSSTAAPDARRERPLGPADAARQSHAVPRNTHQGAAREHSEREHSERPMQLQSRHAGTRPQAPARPRARNEAAEARQMYEQLWGVQRSPARPPGARTTGAPRPRARTGGNRVRAAQAADAVGDAAMYRGQGAIINLSDDGSVSDDSAHSAPAASQSPPAAPHNITDLTSPDPPASLARSWSPNLRSSPLGFMRDPGSHAQRHLSMSPLGHSDGHMDMDDMDAQFEHPFSSFAQDNNDRDEGRRGSGRWDRSLSPMGEPRDRVRPRPSLSSGSPSPPARSPPFPGRQHFVQQPVVPSSDQPQPQPRCRNLADLDGTASAQPRAVDRENAPSRHHSGSGQQPKGAPRKRASKRPTIPLPGRGALNSGKPRSPVHSIPGTAREALYQDDYRSGSDMSGAPEDDGDDSQDGDATQAAARRDADRRSASPERGGQQMITGAQRRRMKRLHEDQQLAEEDPEAWARLQQARTAMMPYGWDKRKELHPIGAALDPTAFEADEPVPAPLVQQHPPNRQAENNNAQAAARGNQGEDSNSDDDFNRDIMHISRPVVPMNRQTSEPPRPDASVQVVPADDAPSDPPYANLQTPSDVPLKSTTSNRDSPQSASLPPSSEPAMACMPAADVSSQEIQARATLAGQRDAIDPDACPPNDAMALAHPEAAVAEEGKHAEGATTIDMEVDAPLRSSSGLQDEGDHADHVEHSTHMEAPFEEHPGALLGAEVLESHVPASSSRRDTAALSEDAATQVLQLHRSPKEGEIVASLPVEPPESTVANGTAAVERAPESGVEGVAKEEAAAVIAPEPEDTGAVDLDVGAATGVASVSPGKSLGLQNPPCSSQHTSPPLISAPVCSTDGAEAGSKPSPVAVASAEDCGGNDIMLELLQAERVLVKPARPSVQPTKDIPGAIEKMETPEGPRDDAEDPSGGIISDTPMSEAEVAPSDIAASADVSMARSPQPALQRCGSDPPPTADTKPPCTSKAMLPCSAGFPGEQRGALRSTDDPVCADPVPAHAVETPLSNSMLVGEQAAVPCSTREASEPCTDSENMLAVKCGDAEEGEPPASAKKPAAKPKINKELARLTLFHWDKLAGEHPVGKQLEGIAEQGAARLTRSRACSKTSAQRRSAKTQQPPQAEHIQAAADEVPCGAVVAADSKGHGEDFTGIHPDSKDTAQPHSATDTAPSLNDTHVGRAQDAVASLQPPAAVTVAHSTEKGSSNLVKKRKSRLSRIAKAIFFA